MPEEMIGKTLGTDLEKGKIHVAASSLLERLPEAERADLLERQRKGDPTVIPEFCQRLRDYPIFEEVVTRFEEELSGGIELISAFKGLPPVAPMLRIADLVRAIGADRDSKVTPFFASLFVCYASKEREFGLCVAPIL